MIEDAASSELSGPSPSGSFAYDGLGRRAQKTVNSVLTQFRYDGLDAVEEASGGSSASYLRTLGIDEALVRTDAGDTVHVLGDALGSSVALTTPAGSVATTYNYEPFGRTEVTGTPAPNPFRFTGREDDSTGLYYYGARYYDFVRSRFVNEDPIGLVAGMNYFAYVKGRALNSRDPLGLADFPREMFGPLGHSISDSVGALTTSTHLGIAVVLGALGKLPTNPTQAAAVGVGVIADATGMAISLGSPAIGPNADYLSAGVGLIGAGAAVIAGSTASVVLSGLGLGATVGTIINRDILDNRPGGNPIENILCTVFFQCAPPVEPKCRTR